MNTINRSALQILFLMAIPFLILYFKWAAQDSTSLPGLPAAETESFFEIVMNNLDAIIVSLLSSIPTFFMSLYFLTPMYLVRTSYFKISLYIFSLVTYSVIVVVLTDLIFPIYYFFGTPYVIKVLVPIVLLSGLAGTLYAFNERLNN
ncbi:MAG: hypothetical protein PHY57_00610 [Ignavibacterium sp.]|nr:MAG: hypothetical protein F9K42_06570 [Ignavibacterium sp.]MDD5606990.1 hypothetical protein [Ignavibacterium sp.]MDX9712385.1 hypothetical protein [Ignavibacteriaceae bacterium]